MEKIVFTAVSRNYFNMPVWIAQHQRMFADEGLEVAIELYEGVDEVTNRLRDGRAQLAYGITEHVILDSEAGGFLEIIGGNVNRLPFSFVAGKSIKTFDDLRGKTVGVSSLDAGSSSLVMKLLAARGLEYPRDYKMRAVGPILTRWEMLKSGEIDAGLQGAPLNYMAVDQGFPSLCEPRDEVPFFQFTSLNVDQRWAAANDATIMKFMRAFVRAHQWFFANREGSVSVAMRETGITREYALRAWDEYTADQIFPRDGDANTAAVQALIEISSLIRAVPNRVKSTADGYINRSYVNAAREALPGHSTAKAS
ncbi:ABC transporter substrate-binding protein [Bradyrhizobium canariense]|uniref:ABC-type nitrate/sulfonate/bicarbonate transport system, substrate-binding protein n=1 Tax=Bradyrhizobium canariense TaxID=255045 RepID=A0A1H1WV68_9BRAD|nr:ABC transporter substrate-binding protein [Bradyrhizobium canariense]SDT00892.1 ABC-type nitrate/sulfonate/bicarbonate transport system, substrate-binding protein [Bradyrhizobium canariense]